MIYISVIGAFLILMMVLLWPKNEETEPTQSEPDSFDLELQGRWPYDHRDVKL